MRGILGRGGREVEIVGFRPPTPLVCIGWLAGGLDDEIPVDFVAGLRSHDPNNHKVVPLPPDYAVASLPIRDRGVEQADRHRRRSGVESEARGRAR